MHLAVFVVRLHPACLTVDQLVRDHEAARTEGWPKTTDGARREDLAYADAAQRPQVRAVRDPVRREAVIGAVPRQERDLATGYVGDRDRVGRFAVRSVHPELDRTVQQGVETRTADHRNVSRLVHVQTLSIGTFASYRAFMVAHIGMVTLDTADPHALADFWTAALDMKIVSDFGGEYLVL